MSSAVGKVRFRDGTIMYFRYDGTCDICNDRLFKSIDELDENWRKEKSIEVDEGKHPYEPVTIANAYAFGYHWEGFASRGGHIHCNSLIPNDYTLVDEGIEKEPRNIESEGLPEWWFDDVSLYE